jgi:uncharacterized protein (TIGR02452 family)
MSISRSRAGELGQETVRILEAGHYTAPGGAVVSIGEDLRRAVEGTISYPPEESLPHSLVGEKPTTFEVVNETTLAAALRLVREGHRPAALNFASARNPGGGFLGGARAQEESLARSSGLYACINGNEMYARHRATHDALYTHYAIYSPDVPVVRDDDGDLLERPYLCSFITCPAVNAKVVLERDRGRRGEVRKAMWERTLRVLAVAAENGHEALVLGAWGCGVFGNDTEEVAGLFGRALTENFRGAFARVIFAVVDWSPEERFIGPFRRAFR